MIGRLWLWANETDERTWIVHAVIAVTLAVVTSAWFAVGYYLLREAEQVVNRLAKHEKLHPLDHVMDVAAPAIAVGALWLL